MFSIQLCINQFLYLKNKGFTSSHTLLLGPWLWPRLPGIYAALGFLSSVSSEKGVYPEWTASTLFFVYLAFQNYILCQVFHSHIGLNLILTVLWQKRQEGGCHPPHLQVRTVEGRLRTLFSTTHGAPRSTMRLHNRLWSHWQTAKHLSLDPDLTIYLEWLWQFMLSPYISTSHTEKWAYYDTCFTEG